MRSSVPVAVTGIGCICGAGDNLVQCMGRLYGGTRAPVAPSLFSTNHPARFPVFETDCGGFSFDPQIEPHQSSRTVLLTLEAARQALEDAHIHPWDLKGLRVGACIGTTVGNTLNDIGFYAACREGEDPDMAAIVRYLHANPALALTEYFG